MIDSFLNFIAFEKRYSKHTISSYSIDLSQYITFLESTFSISNPELADYQMIRTWILSLVENKIEPRTVNRKIATLKSFYKYLLRQNRITINPVDRIKAPKIQKRLPVFIEESHIDLLFKNIAFEDTFESTRDRLILELLYATGIRLSELLALKNEHINLIDNSIRVLGKGNKQRVIPIHKNAKEIIQKYNIIKSQTFQQLNTENLILTDKGENAYPVFIQRIVKKYLTMISPADRKSPHVMRHTFATHMLNNGADLTAIKDLMGHSSLAATQIYTHNSIEKLKNIFKQAHPKA